MSFKKYDGNAWQPITPKQLKGISYSGTLPATLTGTKAGYLHRYKIYGNTVQTGTPTPENPIVPNECGERTENLFDEEYPNIIADNPRYKAIYVGDGEFTLSTTAPLYGNSAVLFFLAGKVSSGASTNSNGVWTEQGRTVTAINGYVTIAYRYYINTDPRDNDTMLNSGSTALPYEPYGYKLPLTSAEQSVDIYLGKSQTTRQIKKLVLTGSEASWRKAENGSVFYRSADDYPMISGVICVCTHYAAQGNVTSANNVNNNCVTFSRQQFSRYYIRDDSISTLDDFKTYLQQQYAAGTPVTVWYVLAEPETAVVNEPLMKIGDYTDTIDSTQTSVQIPTAAGSTTISWAGSGLALSQFDSIQEWVDIPTYTYTNGAWVEDT